MTGYVTSWIIAGILSCLFFTFSERRWIRGMKLVDAMMLLIFYICFVIMGPVGLTLLLIAAQAVLDAFLDSQVDAGNYYATRSRQIAAVLRAAADQVAPSDAMEPRNYIPMALECQRIRKELLAIAAELEGGNG